LASFVQGEKMNNNEFNIVDSILEIKASGIDITNDLLLAEGKSIAQLLYDQEKSENPPENS
jgi:hypothetical protein